MPEVTVPTTQTLYPALRYEDAHAAIAWLVDAFGFERKNVYEAPDGSIAHAELVLNGGMLMLGNTKPGDPRAGTTPQRLGGSTGSIYVYVADVDAHHARAKEVGAEIVLAPYDTEYGSREYACNDLEGHGWSFGTYHP